MIEFGTCVVPWDHERFHWLQPPPTAISWRAMRNTGVSHLRLQYSLDDHSLFESFFQPAYDAGMHITGNLTIADLASARPADIEAAAYDFMRRYRHEIVSVSFGNEPGGDVAMSPRAERLDISQGGTFDWIAEVYGPLVDAFVAGVRAVDKGKRIDLFDSESVDVHQRCVKLPCAQYVGRETFHNYGDIIEAQDYSTMAGRNGKPGYASILTREWMVSELGATTGTDPNGVPLPVTEAELMELLAYIEMMTTNYPQCLGIDLGDAPDYLFTRTQHEDMKDEHGNVVVKAVNYSTFYTDEPRVSAIGQRFVDLFVRVNGPVVGGGQQGRQPGRRES